MRSFLRLAAVAGVSLAAAVSMAGPAAAATSATAIPNSGLHDGDTITVTGAGFPANTTLNALECAHGTPNTPGFDANGNTTSSANCEGTTNDDTVKTNATGNYSNTAYTALILPDSFVPNSSIVCDNTHPCDILLAQDYNDLNQPHAFTGISFADAASTTTVPGSTTTTAPGQGAPSVTSQALLPLGAGGAAGLAFLGVRRRRSPKTSA